MLRKVENEFELFFVDERERIQGLAKQWYVNGNQRDFTEYQDGIRDGRQTLWLKGGELVLDCFRKNGLRHGEYIEYTQMPFERNMVVLQHVIYVRGEIIEEDVSTMSEFDKLQLALTRNVKFL